MNLKTDQDLTKKKAAMFRTLVKKIEKCEYRPHAAPTFEKLFQESKQWRKAQPPGTFEINKQEKDNADLIGARQVSDCFHDKKIIKLQFDHVHPKPYHVSLFTGGPTSNIAPPNTLSMQTLNLYALKIQRTYKMWMAKKLK
jgi:hypothetical protein